MPFSEFHKRIHVVFRTSPTEQQQYTYVYVPLTLILSTLPPPACSLAAPTQTPPVQGAPPGMLHNTGAGGGGVMGVGLGFLAAGTSR